MGQKVVICGVDTSRLTRLSAKESEDLLKKIQDGDEEARERFTLANLRLVLSIIKRFSSAKVSADDLFQAGMIGLIKSIDNFDLSVGVRFSTYAVPMIIGEIKRVIRGNNSLRVSRSIRDTAYKVLQARSEIEAEKDDVATM
ncbi:MAG: sigma-70 family RNA polymerase sigma factor, partial [Clostridia bacterium]|nr:sigma-70 family RNA polymerase sigma factor [Clostridia bacterium]